MTIVLWTEPPMEEVDSLALEILKDIAEVRIARGNREEDLVGEVGDADALVVRLANISRRVIDAGNKIKVIGKTGIGVDNIDLQAATRKGIMVVNVPGAGAESVAEHTFALLLALVKNLLEADSAVREGNWRARDRFCRTNRELSGMTLGIIGLGTIGSRVATRAKSFGMKILAYDPYVSREMARQYGVEFADLDSLLRRSDAVTIHAGLTNETHHLIDRNRLGLMKRSALLINCSRGELVEQEALEVALRDKKIGGAGLDVFEEEPPDLHQPLLGLGNIVVTPHIAGLTSDARQRTTVTLAEDIVQALKGGIPKNLVNKEILEPRG